MGAPRNVCTAIRKVHPLIAHDTRPGWPPVVPLELDGNFGITNRALELSCLDRRFFDLGWFPIVACEMYNLPVQVEIFLADRALPGGAGVLGLVDEAILAVADVTVVGLGLWLLLSIRLMAGLMALQVTGLPVEVEAFMAEVAAPGRANVEVLVDLTEFVATGGAEKGFL